MKYSTRVRNKKVDEMSVWTKIIFYSAFGWARTVHHGFPLPALDTAANLPGQLLEKCSLLQYIKV